MDSVPPSCAARALDLTLRQLQLWCCTGNAGSAIGWFRRLVLQQKAHQQTELGLASIVVTDNQDRTSSGGSSSKGSFPWPSSPGSTDNSDWGMKQEDACRLLLLRALERMPDQVRS